MVFVPSVVLIIFILMVSQFDIVPFGFYGLFRDDWQFDEPCDWLDGLHQHRSRRQGSYKVSYGTIFHTEILLRLTLFPYFFVFSLIRLTAVDLQMGQEPKSQARLIQCYDHWCYRNRSCYGCCVWFALRYVVLILFGVHWWTVHLEEFN